jgi:hypothetical protein
MKVNEMVRTYRTNEGDATLMNNYSRTTRKGLFGNLGESGKMIESSDGLLRRR